jgi:hypothetical protein
VVVVVPVVVVGESVDLCPKREGAGQVAAGLRLELWRVWPGIKGCA